MPLGCSAKEFYSGYTDIAVCMPVDPELKRLAGSGIELQKEMVLCLSGSRIIDGAKDKHFSGGVIVDVEGNVLFTLLLHPKKINAKLHLEPLGFRHAVARTIEAVARLMISPEAVDPALSRTACAMLEIIRQQVEALR